MSTSRLLSLALASLFLSPLLTAAQTGTLDQASPFASEVSTGNGGHFNFDAPSLTWQAETYAGFAGTLEGFELELNGDIGSGVDVAILLGPGWQTSTPVWSGSMTKLTDATEILWADASAAGIHLNAGDPYVIQIQANGSGTWGTGTYDFQGNTFYGPPLFLNAALYGDEFRVGFRTWLFADPVLELLHVGGTCGGIMDFQITGATPNDQVAIIRAFGLGNQIIPGGPCAGVELGLDSTALLFSLLTADANGEIHSSANVSAAACGLVYIQALDVATCLTSTVMKIE